MGKIYHIDEIRSALASIFAAYPVYSVAQYPGDAEQDCARL